MMYPDRKTAGRELAQSLQKYANRTDVVVLALPRGGLPVASEVARALHAPLDVLVVRKLGLPWQPEFAAGAIAPGGVQVINPEAASYFGDLDQTLEPVIRRERHEVERREALYRKGRPPLDLRDRIAIVVDDGMATGSTMEAAVLAARALGAREVVVAVPVASSEACDQLKRRVDRVVCPLIPPGFMAVGSWYQEFPQLTDADVIGVLSAKSGA